MQTNFYLLKMELTGLKLSYVILRCTKQYAKVQWLYTMLCCVMLRI